MHTLELKFKVKFYTEIFFFSLYEQVSKKFQIILIKPLQIPPSFHAVDLQIQVYVGSLYAESTPLHPVHIVASVHPVHVILQAILFEYKLLFYKYEILL